ncbi:MAG: 16S rRNA (cytidine(1402)-2'-O)-methyltransferase [Betaproteobacteria bacterium RIFCSPLOWO2_02_FULL_66_14]|nr:MAG: 16S rRNA (cytidine(1402)-2'-O)-methyltransferase [Betaproteobacteria bacterium RIFCSPLOWO2_02_FULL_66_14]
MTGLLYVVATPIGNLSDAGARAVEVLRSADLVACEDTRTSRTLLAHHGIAARTFALHEHNERTGTARLIAELLAGKTVALVSDAGTPAVSDPGALLVEAAHRSGIRVIPIPGPSAALAAFSASGFAANQVLIAGFLPSTAGARRKALSGLDESHPVVFFEAPHRVAAAVADLAARFGPDREIVIAREITKKFEEIVRLPLGAASAWLASGPHRQQGEFVLVLGPGAKAAGDAIAEGRRVLAVLLEALPASDAARLAARISGAPRRELYRFALERKGGESSR